MKSCSDICSYWLIMVLCVASIGVQISASVAQNIRPVSGVIAVTTAPVQVTYQDITGEHIGRKADTGDPIFLNDVIMTGADVTMQVMLKDQTVFTMGPDSSIRFDTFIYDPADGANGSLSAQVLNGSFKFISGKINISEEQIENLFNNQATTDIDDFDFRITSVEDGDTKGTGNIYSSDFLKIQKFAPSFQTTYSI